MSELTKAPVKPQTGVERALIAIWSQALGVQNIGARDNFFELGGDKSLALHLVEQIRVYLGIEIPSNAIIENPTVKELAQRLESASRRTVENTIHSQKSEYRASFAQVRLYLQYRLDPDSSAYNLFDVYRLHGRLDRKAFEQALLALTQRHESLRTIFYFYEQKGELLQRVVELHLAVAYENLENYSGSEQEPRLRQLVEADARQPFVLETGPLFRSLLITLSPDLHVLVLTTHHIITDGWSQQVMISDLAHLYHAISNGRPSQLPELKMQYGDFAERQREWLSGAEWERQSTYWKTQLSAAPPVLTLPTDHPRTMAEDSSPAGAYSFVLGEVLLSRLHRLSQSNGATLFMTLLAGFQILMSRYCWQDDLCIGTPVANRSQKETEELIGFFVSTLILRANIEDNPPFSEFLGRTRGLVLEALDCADMPFDQIVNTLRPARSLGSTPFVQVMLALQNIPSRLPEGGELTFEPVPLADFTSMFDLTLTFVNKSDEKREITGHFSFNAHLFEQATIERMARCYITLLTAAADDAICPVFQLRILGDQERKLVMEEWNQSVRFCSVENPRSPGFDGVAEATVASPTIVIAPADEAGGDPGRSVSHCQAYILDRYLQPVPPGATGELYLAVNTGASGDVCDHNQQGSRFVENPFGLGTLYRTNQLVHNLHDGRIEVIGRPGERAKAKVPDQRSNLAMMKSALEQHPDVSQCAVVADQGVIVSCVVPKEESLPDLARLRAELRNTLAEYTVPSALIFLSALPFATDGQLDFDKRARFKGPRDHHTPLSPVEKILVDIWERVLGIKNIGIHDNFFRIGGNSLLAISAAAHGRQQGLHFSGRDLFRHQAIADLAKVVTWLQVDVAESITETRKWWPTLPNQRSYFDRNVVNPSLWNAAMLLNVNGAVNPHHLRLATEQLVRQHPTLRLQFRELEGEWIQYLADVNHDDLFYTFDLSHFDHATQLKELLRIGNQLNSSLRFNEGALLRFAVFNLGEQGTRLLIVVHHLVVDAVSMQILLRDLSLICTRLGASGQLEDRKESGLLEWALRMHNQSAMDQTMTEQAYWAPRRPGDVPVDFPGGKNLVATAHRLQAQLSKEESAALMMQARDKYQTGIDVLLLWALATSMQEWQNRQFQVVTMIGHGRESRWAHMDLSDSVGFFAVHYPLVIEIPADTEPEPGVVLVRRQMEAIPNQGIGYGMLQFIHNHKYPDRKIPLQEEGDISFNYLGDHDVSYKQNEVFTIAREETGARLDPRGEGPYKLGLFSYISDGKLQGDWWFNLGFHKLQTIDALVSAFQRNLRRLL